MKALLFSEFYNRKYKDLGYDLYILRDLESKPMYIGISNDSIWHRWFNGGTSHMIVDANGNFHGVSYIGEVIERRLPSSWNWVIELWTKEDCQKLCKKQFTNRNLSNVGIESLEPLMIDIFEPLYNVTYGGGRHEDPLTTEKLNVLYKRIFG